MGDGGSAPSASVSLCSAKHKMFRLSTSRAELSPHHRVPRLFPTSDYAPVASGERHLGRLAALTRLRTQPTLSDEPPAKARHPEGLCPDTECLHPEEGNRFTSAARSRTAPRARRLGNSTLVAVLLPRWVSTLPLPMNAASGRLEYVVRPSCLPGSFW